MKQTLFILLAIFFIIICIVCIVIINFNNQKVQVIKWNKEYEYYLDKQVSGTELASLINKAIDQNEKNSVNKNEKGYYIDNGENSIKIDLKMATIDKTYPMEEIYNNKIINFVKNFNLIQFKCTSVEYHKKTGKVSKLIFEELET